MKQYNAIIPIAAALLLAGCISVLPEQKHAVPRYDVSLPAAAPASAATAEKAAAPALFVTGRVRASDEASGRLIRTADMSTGRTGILTDGELARTPEAIVGAFLFLGAATFIVWLLLRPRAPAFAVTSLALSRVACYSTSDHLLRSLVGG